MAIIALKYYRLLLKVGKVDEVREIIDNDIKEFERWRESVGRREEKLRNLLKAYGDENEG
jgi:hypothetical protein